MSKELLFEPRQQAARSVEPQFLPRVLCVIVTSQNVELVVYSNVFKPHCPLTNRDL